MNKSQEQLIEERILRLERIVLTFSVEVLAGTGSLYKHLRKDLDDIREELFDEEDTQAE